MQAELSSRHGSARSGSKFVEATELSSLEELEAAGSLGDENHEARARIAAEYGFECPHLILSYSPPSPILSPTPVASAAHRRSVLVRKRRRQEPSVTPKPAASPRALTVPLTGLVRRLSRSTSRTSDEADSPTSDKDRRRRSFDVSRIKGTKSGALSLAASMPASSAPSSTRAKRRPLSSVTEYEVQRRNGAKPEWLEFPKRPVVPTIVTSPSDSGLSRLRPSLELQEGFEEARKSAVPSLARPLEDLHWNHSASILSSEAPDPEDPAPLDTPELVRSKHDTVSLSSSDGLGDPPDGLPTIQDGRSQGVAV